MSYAKSLPITEQKMSLVSSFLYDKLIPNILGKNAGYRRVSWILQWRLCFMQTAVIRNQRGESVQQEYIAEQIILFAFLESEVL